MFFLKLLHMLSAGIELVIASKPSTELAHDPLMAIYNQCLNDQYIDY